MARPLPDLAELAAAEPHLILLFDERPEGQCFLAVGCRRSFVLADAHPDGLAALQRFFDGGGWAFGWVGYEAKDMVEPLSSAHADATGFPVLHWTEPRIVVAWGAGREEPEVVAGVDEPDAYRVVAAVQRGLPDGWDPPAPGVRLRPRWDLATYLQRVGRVKRHIQLGDVYELNVCMEWGAERTDLPYPWETFVRLHRRTRAPYSTFVRAHDRFLLCGSPERFLRRRGHEVLSSPIKGTARRGSSPEADDEAAAALAASPKERAENIMICDLVRNDLSRVAVPGSVQVTELCAIHSFATVHQLVSTVRCTCRPGTSETDLLRAAFPMGSMTGAPKFKAMELIESVESTRRGIYSGCVGYRAPSGDLDLNVVIRSIAVHQASRTISAHVGGAITASSDPEAEYAECLLKASALRATLCEDEPA